MSQDGGAFSAYLIGTYERRAGVFTTLQIINPTAQDLEVVVAFYDDKELYQTCLKEDRLTGNDMWEIIVPLHVPRLEPQFGVVKIISHRGGQPARGIVGFQRQILANPDLRGVKCFSESVLASVPTEAAEEELPRILEECG